MRFTSTSNPSGMVELLRHAEGTTVHIRDAEGNQWSGAIERVIFTELNDEYYEEGTLSVSFHEAEPDEGGEKPWVEPLYPAIRADQPGHEDRWASVKATYPLEPGDENPWESKESQSVEVEEVAVDITHDVWDVLEDGDPVRISSPRSSSDVIAGIVGDEERGPLSAEYPIDLYFPPEEWEDNSGVLRGAYRNGRWSTTLKADGERPVPVGELEFGWKCEDLVEEARRAADGLRPQSLKRLVWVDAVVRYHARRDGGVIIDARGDWDGDWQEASPAALLSRGDIEEIVEEDAWAVVRDRDVFDSLDLSVRTYADYLAVMAYFDQRDDE